MPSIINFDNEIFFHEFPGSLETGSFFEFERKLTYQVINVFLFFSYKQSKGQRSSHRCFFNPDLAFGTKSFRARQKN